MVRGMDLGWWIQLCGNTRHHIQYLTSCGSCQEFISSLQLPLCDGNAIHQVILFKNLSFTSYLFIKGTSFVFSLLLVCCFLPSFYRLLLYSSTLIFFQKTPLAKRLTLPNQPTCLSPARFSLCLTISL